MKISLLTTGGTIASVESDRGLQPGLAGEQLLRVCPGLMGFEHDVAVVDLMSKDSSNMHPSDWLVMADCVRDSAARSDAIVMLHGTDTMAWTASALSYLLNDVPVPVVLTGSMLSAEVPDSDVSENIYAAFHFALQLAMYKRRGVSVAFAGLLLHGPRITKIDSRRKNAFVGVDYPFLGEMRDRGTHKIAWLTAQVPALSAERPWGPSPAVETNVALVPIFPGLSARFLDAVADTGPRAVVLEGYGLGGVPFMGENLLPAIERGIARGIPFVLRGQAPFGGTDPAVYEVGRRALDLGVLSARNMTREALMSKLMLLLPVSAPSDLERRLGANLCDDVL
ncbi:asparaginase [uncultured Fretibacterium sp.]|uniref:asparaginase n=1 Tax=uncultured Fretibacterium sp. TaxID=1678694 RepID=UPI00262EC7C3|nr:asparaginase [uncultured Fretibacterium sp.]